MPISFQSQRTYINPQQQQELQKLYDAGMISKGKKCETLHNEAVIKTGLPLKVVLVCSSAICFMPRYTMVGLLCFPL